MQADYRETGSEPVDTWPSPDPSFVSLRKAPPSECKSSLPQDCPWTLAGKWRAPDPLSLAVLALFRVSAPHRYCSCRAQLPFAVRFLLRRSLSCHRTGQWRADRRNCLCSETSRSAYWPRQSPCHIPSAPHTCSLNRSTHPPMMDPSRVLADKTSPPRRNASVPVARCPTGSM